MQTRELKNKALEVARMLRKNETVAEKQFWNLIKNSHIGIFAHESVGKLASAHQRARPACFGRLYSRKEPKGEFVIVLITKCLICNLFAKKVLMLYNRIGLEPDYL